MLVRICDVEVNPAYVIDRGEIFDRHAMSTLSSGQLTAFSTMYSRDLLAYLFTYLLTYLLTYWCLLQDMLLMRMKPIFSGISGPSIAKKHDEEWHEQFFKLNVTHIIDRWVSVYKQHTVRRAAISRRHWSRVPGTGIPDDFPSGPASAN